MDKALPRGVCHRVLHIHLLQKNTFAVSSIGKTLPEQSSYRSVLLLSAGCRKILCDCCEDKVRVTGGERLSDPAALFRMAEQGSVWKCPQCQQRSLGALGVT